MFLSRFRSTGGSTALLEWRIGAFFLSAALGLAGIYLDNSWLVSAALLVLLAGLALRAFLVRNTRSEEQEPTIDE